MAVLCELRRPRPIWSCPLGCVLCLDDSFRVFCGGGEEQFGGAALHLDGALCFGGVIYVWRFVPRLDGMFHNSAGRSAPQWSFCILMVASVFRRIFCISTGPCVSEVSPYFGSPVCAGRDVLYAGRIFRVPGGVPHSDEALCFSGVSVRHVTSPSQLREDSVKQASRTGSDPPTSRGNKAEAAPPRSPNARGSCSPETVGTAP